MHSILNTTISLDTVNLTDGTRRGRGESRHIGEARLRVESCRHVFAPRMRYENVAQASYKTNHINDTTEFIISSRYKRCVCVFYLCVRVVVVVCVVVVCVWEGGGGYKEH